MDLEKTLKNKDRRKKEKMAAAPNLEPLGQDLIDYLMRTLVFEKKRELAALLKVSERTLGYWGDYTYSDLNKGSLSLKVLFNTVERMESDNIPASAILKLLTGRLLKNDDAPTLIEILIENPENRLIEVTTENLVNAFKKEFYTQSSAEDQNALNKRFRLTDEQRKKLFSKVKK